MALAVASSSSHGFSRSGLAESPEDSLEITGDLSERAVLRSRLASADA